MSEHVKRGAELQKDRDVEYNISMHDAISGVWHCEQCGGKLELRQRTGRPAYTEISCECGAVSLDVRIADTLDLDIDEWDTKAPHELDRTEY